MKAVGVGLLLGLAWLVFVVGFALGLLFADPETEIEVQTVPVPVFVATPVRIAVPQVAQQNESIGAWTVELPIPLYCFPVGD